MKMKKREYSATTSLVLQGAVFQSLQEMIPLSGQMASHSASKSCECAMIMLPLFLQRSSWTGVDDEELSASVCLPWLKSSYSGKGGTLFFNFYLWLHSGGCVDSISPVKQTQWYKWLITGSSSIACAPSPDGIQTPYLPNWAWLSLISHQFLRGVREICSVQQDDRCRCSTELPISVLHQSQLPLRGRNFSSQQLVEGPTAQRTSPAITSPQGQFHVCLCLHGEKWSFLRSHDLSLSVFIHAWAWCK